MGFAIVKQCLDWILPPRCAVTGERVDVHGMISADLWRNLTFITSPYCSCCGYPFPYEYTEQGNGEGLLCGLCVEKPNLFTKARAAFVYDDSSRALVLAFKHGDKTILAPTFAQWMINCLSDEEKHKVDCCIPVPLHRWRLLKRRYNQSGLLSKYIAEHLSVPFYSNTLNRKISTPSMEGKNSKQREDNVRGAFSVTAKRKKDIDNKIILLIDDVYTTGATVNSCAKELLKFGAKEVWVLCLARVVKQRL